MQTISLYRYVRADGGVTVSTVKPDGEYSERFRLVADDGYILTDGKAIASCTDTDNPSAWYEVVDNGQEESGDPEEAEATEEDYLATLAELGVSVNEEG